MANDFEYSQHGHDEAAKALVPLGLDDDERAFALQQAAIILQPAAMQYKIDLMAGKKLRPMVVRLALLRALTYINHEVRAWGEGHDRYHYAQEAGAQADAMIAAHGLTPDEEEYVCDLSSAAIRDVEREFMVRAQQGHRWTRSLAIVGAFWAAMKHADDWENHGWLKKD